MNWFRVYIVPRVSVVPCITNLAKCETLKQFLVVKIIKTTYKDLKKLQKT